MVDCVHNTAVPGIELGKSDDEDEAEKARIRDENALIAGLPAAETVFKLHSILLGPQLHTIPSIPRYALLTPSSD